MEDIFLLSSIPQEPPSLKRCAWLAALCVLLLAAHVSCASMRPLRNCPPVVDELECRKNNGVYLPFEDCTRCLRALDEWEPCSYISKTTICRYPLTCDGDVCIKPDEN